MGGALVSESRSAIIRFGESTWHKRIKEDN